MKMKLQNKEYPNLTGLLLGLVLLPLVCGYTDMKPNINYMLLIPAELHYPSTENVCLLLDGDIYKWHFTVKATLEVQGQNLILFKQPRRGFYCSSFLVPPPSEGTYEVGTVKIVAEGDVTFEESKNVLIQRISPGVVVQTDKPSYRPGETVKFRIVTLDENFLCTKIKYYIVELKDPQSNRIFQWLDVKTTKCIADLSFNLTTEPILGTYTINVENGLALKTFVVQEIVLPRFEVTIENLTTIFAFDPTFQLKVCGRYTYGRGVQGNVNVNLCRKPDWFGFFVTNIICTNVVGKTDATGCFQTMVDGNLLNLANYEYTGYKVVIAADLEENGTGVMFSASQTVPVSFAAGTLTFEEMDYYYKGGFPYHITLVLQGRDGTPLKFKKASLEVKFTNQTIIEEGNMDKTGRASFNLKTTQWKEQVRIRGYISSSSKGEILDAVQDVRPFYSKAISYLKLQPIFRTIPCGSVVNIKVEYKISPGDLEKDWKIVKFYYMVIGKGGMMLHGKKEIQLLKQASLYGYFTVPITFTSKFGPAPKMLGFLLLKNGSVTADRLLFKVEKCFPNQAWLKFARTEASPKAKLSLHIGSSAGSLCAIRAVDKSVQISNEEKELTIERVFELFPYTVRGGYPDMVEEGRPYLCWMPLRFAVFNPYYPQFENNFVDVITFFKETGIKVLTNTQILHPVIKPVSCIQPMVEQLLALKVVNTQQLFPVSASTEGVRKFFPDTWLWDLVPIGKFGRSSIEVTVPDTITLFNARAFCMGDSGFGLSPQVSLTVFKPFFVDLALPYSIVQGETLSLKASVFNYLNQCLMVQITLLSSEDFSEKKCQDCVNSRCVCASQAVTFSWDITANKIGLLTLTVRAEAVTSNNSCEGKKPYVPPGGTLDILQRQLLVKPTGIRKEITENMYLCLNASVKSIENVFSLKLPKTWVEKSESAYVSVLGDILGGTVQNLDQLIKMPYGCGEQNMLTMAPIVYVLDYLKATGQLSADQNQKAVGYLQNGYQRQLSYKHTDGSYSAFGMSDNEGSTWLTAFVIKCFYQAKRYIFIDDEVLKDAVTWLGLQQKADGCFISRGKLFHTLMKGGVEDDLSLSAYITAALLERGTPGNDVMLVAALSCLKNQTQQSSNPYTMALLAYTFALANDTATKQILLDRLFPLAVSSGGSLYWKYTLQSSQGSVSASIELSSYVLLALTTAPTISANDILKAFPIVSWLTKQLNSNGGFLSTQDTVIAIQALAKYTSITFNSKANLVVTVSRNKTTLKQFTVNESNLLLLQTAPLPDISGEYSLLVKGTGCVLIQSVLKYNEVPVPEPSAFSIVAKIEGCDLNTEKLTLIISVRYTGKRNVTNMVLIEVEMLSGFQPEDDAGLKLQKFPLVKKVNVQKNSLTIYLEELDHTQQDYYIIIQQETEVHDLKPANIRVYDYYLTELHSIACEESKSCLQQARS